jgi:hypothetical protein
VSALLGDEAAEVGGLLSAVSGAADALMAPDQVYATLWSHAGGKPGHIHWVVQPVSAELMSSYGGLYGPKLQVAMFERNQLPAEDAVLAVAERFRDWFAQNPPVAASRDELASG